LQVLLFLPPSELSVFFSLEDNFFDLVSS